MVLLFGYDEEGCKTAGNIQPEQALTEQFPVFAHCLILRLHRFQFRRTVIQLSGNPDKRGEHRCGEQVGNRVEPAPFHFVRQGREPARQHIPSPCLEQKMESRQVKKPQDCHRPRGIGDNRLVFPCTFVLAPEVIHPVCRFLEHRFLLSLFSACLSRYGEQQQGASRCGGNDQPQPETVTPFTQRTQPEIPFPTSRTGVRPPPSADNPHKPQQQDSRHDQVAVPRMRLQPLRQTLHKLAYLIEPFHSNNRKSQIHTLRTNRYTSKQK